MDSPHAPKVAGFRMQESLGIEELPGTQLPFIWYFLGKYYIIKLSIQIYNRKCLFKEATKYMTKNKANFTKCSN